MVVVPWFIDPTDDASYPLRSLFMDSYGSISFDDFHNVAHLKFPDLDPQLLEILIHTDPMISIRGLYYHYNWPGISAAKEILVTIAKDLEDEDSIQSIWDKNSSFFQSNGLENVYEFHSFLTFRQNLLIGGSIDAVALQSILDSMDSDIDTDDSVLTSVLEYLDSVQGYSSFEDICCHCSWSDSEKDSIRSSMNSCSRITRFGDYCRSHKRRNVCYLQSFRWPRDSRLFLPSYFRENKNLFERFGYYSDFELIKDLSLLYPKSLRHICIFDTHEICKIRDNIIRNIVQSHINQSVDSTDLPYQDIFASMVSDHKGSFFSLSEAQKMCPELPREALIHTLYRYSNTYVDGDRVWVYDIDTSHLVDILSDYSCCGKNGIRDVLKDTRLLNLNIIIIWGLVSLIMRHCPEVVEPVSETFDFVPLGDPDVSCPERDCGDQTNESLFSVNDLAVYEAVEKSGTGNLFKIRKALPGMSSDDLDKTIQNLINSGCVKRGPLGLVCIQDKKPSVFTDEGNKDEYNDLDPRPEVHYIHESVESRLFSLQSFEELMSEVIEESVGYDPSSLIPQMISDIKGKRVFEAVQAVLYEENDIDKTLSKLSNTELDRVFEFCENVTYEEDRVLFSRFDIPSNLFMFLFNRSREYYNALSFTVERGSGSPQEMLMEMINNGLMVHRSESSEGLMDVRARYFAIFDSLNSRDWLLEKSDEIDAIMYTLFMFNEYSLHRYELVNLCRLLIGHDNHVDSVVNGPLWSSIPDFVRITSKIAEFHTYDTVLGLNDFLITTNDYAYDIGKYMKNNRDELITRGLFDVDSLPWFIDNLGLVSLADGFILSHGDFYNCIFRFIEDNQLFDCDLVLKKYIRKYGGDMDVLKPIVAEICSNLQKQEIVDEDTLVDLKRRFQQHQWVTLVNAKSMVEDKCGLKGMFSASLMHTLGFNAQGDVFYRTEYKNFRECLRDNEFSGDDLYLDNSFRVKMECNELNNTLQYFVVNLMWIRVSDSRYINLRTKRFEYLYHVLKKYKDIAYESCKGCFVTPFSFNKKESGFPEIDEDDFGLEFYEDVLLASRSRMSSIGGNHVFYNPVDSEYNCTASDFIKYIVANTCGGTATIAELQGVLDVEYGIRLSLPIVRQFASQSCILLRDLDRAYSSEERYLEDVQGVQ